MVSHPRLCTRAWRQGLAWLLILGLFGGAEGTRASDSQPNIGLPEITMGLKAGVSFGQHYGTKDPDDEYTVSSDWREAFAGGIFFHFPITARFGLQNELMYSQKGSRQHIGVDILDIPTVLEVTYDADYIEIPVLTRFAWVRSRTFDFYSLAGMALSLKVHDRYQLVGEVSDGEEVVPLRADSDMAEVDMFDYSFVYGLGLEFRLFGSNILLEHRFTIGWNTLQMPTYAYVPFGEDEQILIENDPVPLRNQNHLLLMGVHF